MLKAIVVDDEPYCCEIITTLLEDVPEVVVVAVCCDGESALAAIQKQSPDIVFLDVEMPKMNGFEMLERLPSVDFEIIFTTSYDQYALKAIRFSAIDYLLKPIDREELMKALKKVMRRSQKPTAYQLEVLMQKLADPKATLNKLALPTMDGLQMITIASIIYCESDNNYTILQLKGQPKLVVSKTLKEIEELLEGYSFVRVHRSYLVNINEVEKYHRGEGGYLVLSNGASVDVSKSRKEYLLSRLLPKK